MTFVYANTPDLATAARYLIWRFHFDFPDTARDLPDYRARLTSIAESAAQMTRVSLYVICEALEWKQKQLSEFHETETVFPDRTAVLGFQALGNIREKYKYLKILYAREPSSVGFHCPNRKGALRKKLLTRYLVHTEEARAHHAIFDQLADHCLTLLNTDPAEQRRYVGFHPYWSDRDIYTRFKKRTKDIERKKRAKESKRRAAVQPSKTYIYFIQQGEDGPIKVGYSTSPKERLKALQTASPYALHLFKVVEGNEEMEKQIHSRFAEVQLQGEWFQPTESLLAYIEALK
jgi:hypothetical protein